MKGKTPKTSDGQFVFFPKGGDISFCPAIHFLTMLEYMKNNPQTTFLVQTKEPTYFQHFRFPENVISAITLETDLSEYSTPSKYQYYHEISLAPSPLWRFMGFINVNHPRKAVTIEPILQFSSNLIHCLTFVKPKLEFVYVGYDTKNCKLPEPTLSNTQNLISRLKQNGLTVRKKTLRQAWWRT